MNKLISIIILLFLTACTNLNEEIEIKSGDNKSDGIIIPSGEITTKIDEPIENLIEPEEKELFEDYYEKAEEIVATMSLEEKIGQMFLARYPVSESLANDEIAKYNPGGYILFARDVKNETKDSLKTKLNNNQESSKIKMFIAVDEEGGTVARVSAYTAFRDSKFKAPLKIYEQSGMAGVISDSKEKSELLRSVNINMNLAPVVDVPTNKNSFMYARSMGTDSIVTSDFASQIVTRMNEDKMISCLKHFPGYGDNVDTHTGIAIDEREYEEFVENDFKPFVAGIEAGVPSILVNHNVINCMDKELPASLSKNVHDVLRNELGFTGIIMTDDLAMDAVKSYVENGEAAVQAVIAGNDVIITSSLATHCREVINAVNNGTIDEAMIDMAVKRILACKMYYGIIE